MAVDWRKAAMIGLRLDPSRFVQDIARAKKRLRAFGADAERFLGKKVMRGSLFRKGGGMLAGAAGGLAAGAGFGAIAGLQGVVADVLDFEKALVRFQITTDKAPAQIAELRDEIGRLSTTTGISRGELLAGASAYVALTGDADGAARSVQTFARVQNATGASMADIASSAAALKDNLRIDPSDFEAAFSALHVQGKAGAVELRELATELAGVTPTFAQFAGGKGVGGLVQLGSALQVVRKGFGSSSEAATGLQSLMVALTKNAKRFEAKGVKVFTKDPKTGKKSLNNLLEIVEAIGKSSLAKDPTALTKAFGRDEARRAYEQLVQNADLLDELREKSADQGAVARDAMTFQTSTAGRLAIALETLKTKIADVFTPERISAFVDALGKLVDLLGTSAKFVDWISKGMPKRKPLTPAEMKLSASVGRDARADIEKENELAAARRTLEGGGGGLLLPELRQKALAEVAREQKLLNDLQVFDFQQFTQGEALRKEMVAGGAAPEDLAGLSYTDLLVRRAREANAASGGPVEVTVKINDQPVVTAIEQSREHRRGLP